MGGIWDTLLEEHKLRVKVAELDQVDEAKGHTVKTKEICQYIYYDYVLWRGELEARKAAVWNIFEKLQGVHLHTSRVKSLESLIDIVIRKRHEWLGDDNNKYANINAENYRDIITDLAGVRLIINYRGRWLDMHKEILSRFPLDADRIYENNKLLAHIPDRDVQAELPKAYYAEGDDIKQYVENGLLPKKHKMNYRSIHYTLSFEGTYIEVQVRTIYDEVWSDCDHNYVYKKDDNKSHAALEQMSDILSKLTNLSNDIGEQMKSIYDSETVIDNYKGGWKTTRATIAEFDKICQRMERIEEDFRIFRNKLTVDETIKVGKGDGKNG